MNKLQWLQDGILASQVVGSDKISVLVDEGDIEYSWNPEDLTIGLEYTADVLISDYAGKTAVLFMVIMDVLREIDPRRDANKHKPQFKASLLSPNLWDCRIAIHFKEDQTFLPGTPEDHDINIDGQYYKTNDQKPAAPQALRTVNYLNRSPETTE